MVVPINSVKDEQGLRIAWQGLVGGPLRPGDFRRRHAFREPRGHKALTVLLVDNLPRSLNDPGPPVDASDGAVGWLGAAALPPLVSCVLVIQDACRLGLAGRAVEFFLEQDYARRRLVIINGISRRADLDTRVCRTAHPLVVECLAPPGLSLGGLRNRGLDVADGDWVAQWDDDDYSHPHRLSYQMAHRSGHLPVLLRRQVRLHVDRGLAFYHDEPSGAAGTLLHPRTETRYPEITAGEDLAFRVTAWPRPPVVVDNRTEADSLLSLAFFHGRNATPEWRWMRRQPATGCDLSDRDLARLAGVCGRYGLDVGLPSGASFPPQA